MIPLIGGIFYTLAFAPFNLAPLGIFAVLLFIISIYQKTSARAAFSAFIFGLSAFTSGVSWVYVAISVYGGADFITAAALTALLIVYLSSLFALLGYCFNKLFPTTNNLKWLVGLPCLWVLFEMLRGTLFTGFPWAYVGVSQIDMPIAGYASLLGVYGVSAISVLTASLIFLILTQKTSRQIFYGLSLVCVWGLGLVLMNTDWTHPNKQAISVALLQGNVPIEMKWSTQHALDTVEVYNNLTLGNWGSKLIIWPEGALPIPMPESIDYVKHLGILAKQAQSSVIVSAPIRMGLQKQYYNGMVTTGVGSGSYFKHHLLPFGDYVPLEQYLRGLISFFDLPMSSYKKGPKKQPPIVVDDSLRLAPLICYEIAFADLTRLSAKHGNMIVTVSEDTWFGHSIGPHQHLQQARMRALETGKPVLRATNTGLTAAIDHKGKIISQLPAYEIGVLNADVYPTEGNTPWAYVGKLNVFILLSLCLLLCSMVSNRIEKHRKL